MKAVYLSPRDMGDNVRLARRPIAEIMSKPAVTVAATASLDDALAKMLATGLRHLAVVDANGRSLGILSDRTIAAAWASDYYAMARHLVVTSLDIEPAMIRWDAGVIDAARFMRDNATDAVAVVDASGKPIGVVTGGDLVSLLAR